jgi:DNA-binding transcriptional regulator YdaS (Cro superfamily)
MEKIIESPIERACSVAGGQAALGRGIGVSAAMVNQWVRGLRPIPAHLCPEIEKLTGIRCEELNDRVDWAYLRAASSSD